MVPQPAYAPLPHANIPLSLPPPTGTGRIAFFNGYGWSVTRWGADNDRIQSLAAAAPNRCHAVIGTYASQAERLFLWNGVSWVLKVHFWDALSAAPLLFVRRQPHAQPPRASRWHQLRRRSHSCGPVPALPPQQPPA